MRLLWFIVLCLSLYTGYIYYTDDDLNLPSFDDSTATSSEMTTEETATVGEPAAPTSEASTPKPPSPAPTIVSGGARATGPTAAEIEAEAKKIEDTLSALAEDMEEMKLYEPRSPHAGKVKLEQGNASAQTPQSEYLTLSALSTNGAGIAVTGWKLESYVTNSEAVLPEGARFLTSENAREKAPIMLLPGEIAHIVTGETPLRVSFRENECAGYLSSEGSFGPGLGQSCPLPSDELLQYGNVKSTDKKCYDYVQGIGRCTDPDDTNVEAAELSGSCEMFIQNVLSYEGCVSRHSDDASFYTNGSWRIFLNRSGELWRSSKDVVRLLDAEGKVVSVLEY